MRIVCFLLLSLAVGCARTSTTPRPDARMGDPLHAVSAERLYRKGITLARHGDPIRAEQYLQAAAQQGFPARVAIPRLVEVCVTGNRIRAALGHVLPHLREHPHDWPMRHLAASLELALKRPARARDQLEEVLAQAAHPPSQYLLGVVLEEALAEPDAAYIHFQRYLELAPEGRFARAARNRLQQIETPREASKGETP